MRSIIFFFGIFLFLSIASTSAQLNLTNAPRQGAFLARNLKTNSAIVAIQGNVTDPSATSFYIRIYQSGALFYKRRVSLNFSGGVANFNQWFNLPSGKYTYKIDYELIGSSSISFSTDEIMVGDVYLIQGQSNAVASSFQAFDKAYNDVYCRSFGSSSNNGAAMQADTNWYPTNGTNSYTSGAVGQWGAVMAKLLVDSFSIPICFLNGAVGGTTIGQHQMDPSNPENLSTIYGRLLYRVRKAEYENSIRAILYFQGESDGPFATRHDTLFQKLHQNWINDYPGFKKLYVIQVRSGCGGPSIQLRDVQRRFEDSLVNCKVVSANGLNSHDGCHYGFDNGYKQLGIQMAALIGRDFYGSLRKNIDPPNIKSCHYSNAKKTEITLEMKNAFDDLYVDSLFHQLFKIEGDANVSITKGEWVDNKIVLQLNQSSCKITGLTYDGLPLKRAWVKNSLDMGLISFYNVPILQLSPQEKYSACKNSTVTLKAPFIYGCTYTWIRKSTKSTSQGLEIKVSATEDAQFTLLIHYDKSLCKQNDTFEVSIEIDRINIPDLGIDRMICVGDSLLFAPDTLGFEHFSWQGSRATLDSFVYLSDTNETIELIAQSKMGCTYVDQCKVFQRVPKIVLPEDTIICLGEKIIVAVADTFANYYWNNSLGSDSFNSEAGTLVLRVRDSSNCEASDTMIIDNFKAALSIELPNALCKGKTTTIFKNRDINSWYMDSKALGDSLVLTSPSTTPLQLIDTNFCSTHDTLLIEALPLPFFDLGNDSGFCSNGELFIQLPVGPYKYYWNDELLVSSSIIVNKEGSYEAILVDSNSCIYSDSIAFQSYGAPSLDQFFDSTLCENEKWIISLPVAIQYTLNGQSVFDSITFQSEGIYRIEATNEYNCASKKTIDIQFKKCDLLVPSLVKNHLYIYPNPTSGRLMIVNSNAQQLNGNLYSTTGEFIRFIVLSPGGNVLDLKHLEANIYLLKAEGRVYRIFKMN
jgi:hypothetical protein